MHSQSGLAYSLSHLYSMQNFSCNWSKHEVVFCYSGKVQMYTVQHLNAVTGEYVKGQQEKKCHLQAPCHQLCESAGSLVITRYVCPGAASVRQGLQVPASTQCWLRFPGNGTANSTECTGKCKARLMIASEFCDRPLKLQQCLPSRCGALRHRSEVLQPMVIAVLSLDVPNDELLLLLLK